MPSRSQTCYDAVGEAPIGFTVKVKMYPIYKNQKHSYAHVKFRTCSATLAKRLTCHSSFFVHLIRFNIVDLGESTKNSGEASVSVSVLIKVIRNHSAFGIKPSS